MTATSVMVIVPNFIGLQNTVFCKTEGEESWFNVYSHKCHIEVVCPATEEQIGLSYKAYRAAKNMLEVGFDEFEDLGGFRGRLYVSLSATVQLDDSIDIDLDSVREKCEGATFTWSGSGDRTLLISAGYCVDFSACVDFEISHATERAGGILSRLSESLTAGVQAVLEGLTCKTFHPTFDAGFWM